VAEYVGGFTVGGAIPLAAVAVGAANATILATLPDAQARLAGAVQAGIAVSGSPPSLAAIATLGAAAAASIQAMMVAPSVGVSAAAVGEIILELGAVVAALEVQANLIAELQGILSTAGVHMYITEGEIGAMGTDLQSVLAGGIPGGSGPSQLGSGFFIVAADNGTIAILRSVLAS
jgi:hypothetical protein